jgi:predicted nucleotidyltransferase
MFGLEKDIIEKIISCIKKNTKVKKAVLFGSRAKGNYRNGSDIDISLFGNELILDDILNISIEIDNLEIPYKIDLIINDRIKEKQLQDHIERVGIILFEN